MWAWKVGSKLYQNNETSVKKLRLPTDAGLADAIANDISTLCISSVDGVLALITFSNFPNQPVNINFTQTIQPEELHQSIVCLENSLIK